MSISVVIPAYNASRYIGEAIESVLSQTEKANEIIVVDDCSTDNTAQVVKSFGSDVSLFRNHQNRGPGYCRNLGVSRCHSDLIAFLDADDVWLPHHLSVMQGLLCSHPSAAMAFGPVRSYACSDDIWPVQLDKTNEPHDFFSQQLQGGVIQTSTMVLYKKIFDSIGGFDEIECFAKGRRVQAEDYDLSLKLSYGHHLIASPYATVKYRLHAEQSSVLVLEQTMLNFQYRVRFLKKLTAAERNNIRVNDAVHRMQIRWELTLENYCGKRANADLWRLVIFGFRYNYFRIHTWPYLWRVIRHSLHKG